MGQVQEAGNVPHEPPPTAIKGGLRGWFRTRSRRVKTAIVAGIVFFILAVGWAYANNEYRDCIYLGGGSQYSDYTGVKTVARYDPNNDFITRGCADNNILPDWLLQ